MPCNAFPISRIQMLPFLFELHSDITIVIRGGFILIWSLCWLFALSKWIGRVETYEGCIRWCSAVTVADVITVGMQCLSRRVQNNECGTKSYTRKKKKKGQWTCPLLSQPGPHVFCDSAVLTLSHYGWQWSAVWRSRKYTFKDHNRKMENKDMTGFSQPIHSWINAAICQTNSLGTETLLKKKSSTKALYSQETKTG